MPTTEYPARVRRIARASDVDPATVARVLAGEAADSIDPKVRKHLQAAEAKFRKAEALREQARLERTAAIRAAVAGGCSQVDVARVLGVTKARINTILKGAN